MSVPHSSGTNWRFTFAFQRLFVCFSTTFRVCDFNAAVFPVRKSVRLQLLCQRFSTVSPVISNCFPSVGFQRSSSPSGFQLLFERSVLQQTATQQPRGLLEKKCAAGRLHTLRHTRHGLPSRHTGAGFKFVPRHSLPSRVYRCRYENGSAPSTDVAETARRVKISLLELGKSRP